MRLRIFEPFARPHTFQHISRQRNRLIAAGLTIAEIHVIQTALRIILHHRTDITTIKCPHRLAYTETAIRRILCNPGLYLSIFPNNRLRGVLYRLRSLRRTYRHDRLCLCDLCGLGYGIKR